MARTELVRSAARHRTAIPLSDTVHNAGTDPRPVARRFPELDLLLETGGEHNAPLGRNIARMGRGRCGWVASNRDVVPALNRILTS